MFIPIRLNAIFTSTIPHLEMILDDTPKRFDRIVAIFIQLQSKRIVRAQDLAERFDVSLRTIYRDIRTLEASGVPIYGESGIGYSLMEGYRLPPMMFSPEETASFVAAEKLMQKFTDTFMQGYFSSAMAKVRAILKSNDKDRIEKIESQVLMQPMQLLKTEQVSNVLAILFESIARKTKVELLYKRSGAEQASLRTVEPVGVFHQDDYWYIIAYCYLRDAYRQFRTDRIEHIKQTDLHFEQKHEPLHYYLTPKEKTQTTPVCIDVELAMMCYVQWERNYFGFVGEKITGGVARMTFEVTDLDSFARWFLLFSDQATIVEPPELKVKVKAILSVSIEKIEELPTGD